MEKHMIGFDLDGVIIKIGEILQREILKKHNYDIYDCRHTYYINVPGLSHAENQNLVYDIIINHGMEANPYPGAIESLINLYKTTQENLTFVTARDPQLVGTQTWEWLKKYLGPTIPFHVEFIPSKSKAEYLYNNKFKTFVDDRLRNVNDIAEYLDAVFLINRPWNINRETKYNVIRVDSVVDVCERYINSKRAFV